MAKAFLRKLNKRYEVSRLFSLVFRSTSIFLSLKGVYAASKSRVIEEFKRMYPSECRASRWGTLAPSPAESGESDNSASSEHGSKPNPPSLGDLEDASR